MALSSVYSFLVSRASLLAIGVQPQGHRVVSDTQANAQAQLAAYLAATFPADTCRIETGGTVMLDQVVSYPATSVAITPTTASVPKTTTKQFYAAVSGSGVTDLSVTWTASVGTISAAGLYTAGAGAGADLVTATSVADATKSASAVITVT